MGVGLFRLKEIARNRSIAEFLWVAAPKSLAGVLQLLLSFLLLQYLSPEDFGVVSVCLMVIVLSDAVLGPSVDLSVLRVAPLIRDGNPEKALNLQKTALILKMGAVTFLALPILLFARSLSRLFFQREAVSLLLLSVLSVFGVGLLRSVQTYFQTERHFAIYGIADLSQSAIKFAAVGIAIFLFPSPILILTGQMMGPLLVAAILLNSKARPLLASSFDPQAARQLWKQIRLYLTTTIVGSSVSRMDLFFVTAGAGAAQAGIFSAANTIALIPQLLGMYMSVVFTPRIMKMWHAGTFGATYRRFQAFLGLGCLSILAAAYLVFPAVAPWILPSSFEASTKVFLILLPAALCSMLTFPWTVPFLLFTRPRTMLALDLTFLPLLVFLYSWASSTHGAAGAAAVTTGFALVKTGFMQGLALFVIKQGPSGENSI